MNHIKYAGAVEKALETIADKMELHKHPFETIFSTMLPAMIWPASRLLSSFMFIADAVGYGPSLLGKYIDEKLGFHSGSPDLSDGKLREVASSFSDKIFSTVGMKAESDMDIFFQKESFSIEDVVVLSALTKGKPVIKEAVPGRASFLKGFMEKMFKGQRLGPMNILYYILKTFAKGLLGLGIAKGGVEFVKEKAEETQTDVAKEEDSFLQFKSTDPASSLVSGKLIPYSNVFGNVEESLIEHLKDIKINYEGEVFPLPEFFEKEKTRPLKGSPEMEKLMKNKILPHNQVLNDPVFIAPKLKELGRTLLPHIVMAKLIGNLVYSISTENPRL